LILAAIGLIWFSIPIFYGVINIGSAAAIVFCLLVLFGAAFYGSVKTKYKNFQNRKRAKSILIVCSVLVATGILWAMALTGCMIFGANAAPPKDATVVVLGSQVKGSEPSLDLLQRINAATDYLKANPQAKCIVSGGQGENEQVTEASVMQRYLVQNGIDASRIIEEDTSTTTQENLKNSLKIIEQRSFSKNIAIVTDEYHQFRAGVIARRTGLTPYSVCAHTPWFIFSACYARELLAITKAVVF
jgi:uncharacterized SAM-binding protein YcdF (DUF218 family)